MAKANKALPLKRYVQNQLLIVVMGLLLLYFLITQAQYLSDYTNALNKFDPFWLVLVIGATFLTFYASTIVTIGASQKRLKFEQVFVLQLAAAFVNRLTPKSIGGVAVTERYLENSGVKRTDAVATVSLSYLCGVLVHFGLLFLIVTFFNDRAIPLVIPSGWTTIVILFGLLVVASLSLIPKVQRVIVEYIQAGLRNLARVITSPYKVLQLFGGSAGVTLSFGVAFYFSLRAFGILMPVEEVILIYLGATIIASAAPTPGGLGAAEASLVGGLLAFGIATGPAVTAVLAFRLVTFWLPVLPGILALKYLRLRKML